MWIWKPGHHSLYTICSPNLPTDRLFLVSSLLKPNPILIHHLFPSADLMSETKLKAAFRFTLAVLFLVYYFLAYKNISEPINSVDILYVSMHWSVVLESTKEEQNM